MFLARVLVGEYSVGHHMYCRPPSKDTSFTSFYDSCVDDMANPKIYVIFDSNQIYPEYMIEFYWGPSGCSESLRDGRGSRIVSSRDSSARLIQSAFREAWKPQERLCVQSEHCSQYLVTRRGTLSVGAVFVCAVMPSISAIHELVYMSPLTQSQKYNRWLFSPTISQ